MVNEEGRRHPFGPRLCAWHVGLFCRCGKSNFENRNQTPTTKNMYTCSQCFSILIMCSNFSPCWLCSDMWRVDVFGMLSCCVSYAAAAVLLDSCHGLRWCRAHLSLYINIYQQLPEIHMTLNWFALMFLNLSWFSLICYWCFIDVHWF